MSWKHVALEEKVIKQMTNKSRNAMSLPISEDGFVFAEVNRYDGLSRVERDGKNHCVWVARRHFIGVDNQLTITLEGHHKDLCVGYLDHAAIEDAHWGDSKTLWFSQCHFFVKRVRSFFGGASGATSSAHCIRTCKVYSPLRTLGINLDHPHFSRPSKTFVRVFSRLRPVV